MKSLALIVILLSLTSLSFEFNPLRKMARQRRLKVSEDTAAIKNPRVKSFNREMAQKLFSSMHPLKGSSQKMDLRSLKPKASQVKKLSGRFPAGMQSSQFGQNFNAQQSNPFFSNPYASMNQYNTMQFGAGQNGLQSMLAASQQQQQNQFAMSNARQTAGFATPFNIHPLSQSGGPGGGRFGKNRKFNLVTPEEHEAALKTKEQEEKLQKEQNRPDQPLKKRKKKPVKPEEEQYNQTKNMQPNTVGEPKQKSEVKDQNPPKEAPNGYQNRESQPMRRARVDMANPRRYQNRQRNERRQFRNMNNQQNRAQKSNEYNTPDPEQPQQQQRKSDVKTLKNQQRPVEEEANELDTGNERQLDNTYSRNDVKPKETARQVGSQNEANPQLEDKQIKTKNLKFMIDDSKKEEQLQEPRAETITFKKNNVRQENMHRMSDAELETIVDDPEKMQQLLRKYKKVVADMEN